MIERGLEPDFPADVEKQLDGIDGRGEGRRLDVRDLRELLWCSIDNDDSRDLDQLTVAEDLGGGNVRASSSPSPTSTRVVKKGTPIDDHARHNTTSVYTAAQIFPMLPEKLSTDLTSLNEDEERLAMVIDMTVGRDGTRRQRRRLPRARAQQGQARLQQRRRCGCRGEGGRAGEGGGREGAGREPASCRTRSPTRMRELRHEHGALDLETIEPRAGVRGRARSSTSAPRRATTPRT